MAMGFPQIRLRRLRQSEVLRRMMAETVLVPKDFIFPLFVCPGKKIKNPISSMPGQYQFSCDLLLKELEEVILLKIPAILLFGIPARKDTSGSEAYAKNGIIQTAVQSIKKAFPDLIVITDLCFCEYLSHGHCGILKGKTVDNDLTLKLIARTALSQAEAGADMIAPSDMMDGRVAIIRQSLDQNGFKDKIILSYAAKYASAFYGPFRDAVGSAPQFGDRKTYQMDPSNKREALREIALDIEEGADIVMVKPALSYLDIIVQARQEFDVPIAAYNVSGEYAMVKAAEEKGWIEGTKVMVEILTSIKRAGADLIISYHAKEVIPRLNS